MGAVPTLPALPAFSKREAIGRIEVFVGALLVLGVFWRLLRYVLQFPIWGDEAHIALNVLERDFAGLAQPLRFVQTAPILFLWAERVLLELLGTSELVLRLPALLGGLAGLLLFWRATRSLWPGLAGAAAIGILAVSYYPVRHACEVKPYGTDLGATMLLLWLALNWIQQPDNLRWLVLLTLAVPCALGLSYPTVFVAGTISVALLPTLWQHRNGKTIGLYLAYNLLMLGTFAGIYLLVGAGQHASEGGTDNVFFTDCFPPKQLSAVIPWLINVHTGAMFAYPRGGAHGASALTGLLCAIGLFQLVRQRPWQFLVLCVGPFALTLLAAALHRYPYGGSARYEQHLAPAICWLMGLGLAAVLSSFRSESARGYALQGAFLLLIALGIGGVVWDVAKPYKLLGDQQVRQVVRDVLAEAGPHDQIVVLDPPPWVGPTFEWYIDVNEDRIRWATLDWDEVKRAQQVWGLYFQPGAQRAVRLQNDLNRTGCWTLTEHTEHRMQQGATEWTIEYCDLYHWERDASAKRR